MQAIKFKRLRSSRPAACMALSTVKPGSRSREAETPPASKVKFRSAMVRIWLGSSSTPSSAENKKPWAHIVGRPKLSTEPYCTRETPTTRS